MSIKYTAISYYTRNTPYEKEVKSLIESLDKFNIPKDIRYIDTLGSWQANTYYKAQFIRAMVDAREAAGDQAILWVDADAVIMRPPDIFNYIDTDAAFYFYGGSRHAQRTDGRELISATMFFKITDKVKDLLDRWIAKNAEEWGSKSGPAYGGGLPLEQWNLQAVLEPWRASGGTISWLPQAYCKMFDYAPDPVVIIQNQASRRFRGVIGDDR